jgi:hypothetical protein
MAVAVVDDADAAEAGDEGRGAHVDEPAGPVDGALLLGLVVARDPGAELDAHGSLRPVLASVGGGRGRAPHLDAVDAEGHGFRRPLYGVGVEGAERVGDGDGGIVGVELGVALGVEVGLDVSGVAANELLGG